MTPPEWRFDSTRCTATVRPGPRFLSSRPSEGMSAPTCATCHVPDGAVRAPDMDAPHPRGPVAGEQFAAAQKSRVCRVLLFVWRRASRRGRGPPDRLSLSMSGEPEGVGPSGPSVGLLARAREHLSLTRVQAIFGILAALISIGGAL